MPLGLVLMTIARRVKGNIRDAANQQARLPGDGQLVEGAVGVKETLAARCGDRPVPVVTSLYRHFCAILGLPSSKASLIGGCQASSGYHAPDDCAFDQDVLYSGRLRLLLWEHLVQ
jgi:hypothetical protein